MAKTVLVIEDDTDIREGLQEVLERHGYNVLTAIHGQHGLDLLAAPTTIKPSVILLDLMLPIMDGWEFRRLQKLDAEIASIPVVIMSAVGKAISGIDAHGYVEKPIDLGVLLQVLRAHAQE